MKLSTPQILDYEVVETIYQSDYTVVWRATAASKNGSFILKTSQSATLREQSNLRIEYEHNLLASLDISGLPKAIALHNYEGNPLLVREYLPGVALSAYLQSHQFTLETFLKIAVQLCDIVGGLHRQNVIHKDLNSNNIIYDAQTQKVYLIDFGSASRIDLKTQNLGNPNRLEGTLNYISPEQTGRMNRIVDYRSDLYSLGVTLFEALTNHLPFPYADALELIHAHMAKIPPSPGNFRADVPEVLSQLILKLLAKNAEDRYQSAYGLKYDLNRIFAPLLDQLPPISFALGSQDFPLKFQIPEKLYGRETERESLLRTFEQVAQGGKALLLVKGEPGTGKSALVDEVHKPMTARRGIFLEGKFDQLQKNIPYFAWSQVIDTFTERLLTEDETSLGQWRNKILAAVGNSGKILSDLNPNLELVIGKQPELPPMDVQETQNRFILTLKRFVGALATAEHPLIIFIDDWQWADIPSVLLLENLFQDEALGYLFLIAAVRHNEIAPHQAFSRALEQMQAFAKRETELPLLFEEVWLHNLLPVHIEALLVDALRAPAKDLAPLQQLVFEKTQGNAFFVHQLLQSLYEEKLLKLEATEKGFRWQWDFEGIQALNITENVVGFMMRKIQKTDPITQQILKTAACIGNYFDLKILSAVYGKALKITYQDLWEGMKEGLIVPTDGARRMHTQFRFVHDRIQQAFYELIPPADRGPTHYQIAKVLQEVIAERDLEVRIFDIINQYNQGYQSAQTQAEQENIAQLNLLASQKAQASAAYAPALSYAQTGAKLLGADGWQRNYPLAMALCQKTLENTYLNGDFDQTEALLQLIREKAQTQLDRVRATETQVKIFKAQGQLEKALQTGIDLLETLRIRLASPNTLNILRELLLTRNRVKVNKIERLLEKRQTTDPLHLAIERILVDMASVVYFVKPDLIPILVAQQVKVALRHGHTVYSPYSYASFGFLLIVGFKDIEAGYRVGQMAEALQRKLPSKQNEGRTNFILNAFIKHWKEPLPQVSANLRQVHQECLENGDFEFAGFAASIGTFYGFLGGISLPLLKNQLDGYVKTAKEKIKALASYEQVMSVMSTVAFHFLPSFPLKTFEGADFEQKAFVQKLEEDKNLATLQTLRLGYLINAYLLEEYELGLPLISLFEQNIQASASGATSAVFHAYRALTYAALVEKASPSQAKKYRAQMEKDEKTLQKWGKKSPANYQNRYWLVRGERLRLEKKPVEAAQAFEEARRLALQHRNLAEEALALELMARLFYQQKQEALVDYFLQKARQAYEKWGSTRKLNQLNQRWPDFKPPHPSPGMSHSVDTTDGGRTNLDLLTVVKSAQVLSGEIVLAALLKKMLDVVLENAGAQRGVLLLGDEKDRLFLQAEIDLHRQQEAFMQNLPLETDASAHLPLPVIQYVARRQETVVLGDAQQPTQFSQSVYLQSQSVRSVFCMPLLRQGKLTGVLYLENNLSPNVFSPERTQLLNLLSSQLAISIENASLYEDLDNKVKQRTQEVLRQKEMLESQKSEIEEQNKKIRSSINYAQRIQQAMLLPDPEIRQLLPESFVLFRPRDVVSGDFYWIRHMGQKTWVAAVDCTGHGVPGALMSAIGHNLLNELLSIHQITEPDLLLNELHLSVRTALRQAENQNRDGMDIALVVIDHEREELHYAGAKNPLVYVQNGELQVIAGDRVPVGGYQHETERRFTKHIVPLRQGGQRIPTHFYLYSDGFADQFGGPIGRKFSSRRLQKLLHDTHSFGAEHQKRNLEETLNAWMAQSRERQVDDVLLIGVKV